MIAARRQLCDKIIIGAGIGSTTRPSIKLWNCTLEETLTLRASSRSRPMGVLQKKKSAKSIYPISINVFTDVLYR